MLRTEGQFEEKPYIESITTPLNNFLQLEPFVDRPELFERGRRLQREDFEGYPDLQQRFDKETEIAKKEISRLNLEGDDLELTLQARDDQFNPYRVSKHTGVLITAKNILGVAFASEAREYIKESFPSSAETDPYDILMKKVNDQITLISKKKSSESLVSQQEVKDTMMIAKITRGVVKKVRGGK